MSSKSGLDIEGMSSPEIQKIVDDLTDKNKTLEYHLSLMKNCFEVFIKIFDKINHSITGEELRQLSALMSQFTDVYKKQSLESVQNSRIWPQIIQLSTQTSDPLNCGSLPTTEEVLRQSSDSQNEIIVEISDNSSDELNSSEEQNNCINTKIIELMTTVSPKGHQMISESNVSTSEDLNQIKETSNEELIVSHNTDSNDSIEWIQSLSAPLLKCRLCGQLYDINTDPKHEENHNKHKTTVLKPKKNRVRNTSYYLSPLPSGSLQVNRNNVCVNDIEAEVRFSVDNNHSFTQIKDKINGSVVNKSSESQSCLKTMLSSDIPSIDSNTKQNKSVFNCSENLCKETFDEEMAFISHSKTVHNKRMKKCVYNECHYFYEKRDHYWSHLKVVHKGQDPPFKCVLNSCGKSFWTNADLNRHINAFHASDRHFRSDNNFQFNSTTLLINSNPFKRIKFSSLVHPNGQLRQNQDK